MPTSFAARISALKIALQFQETLNITDIGANPMNHDAPYKRLHDNGDVTITGFDPQAATLPKSDQASGSTDRYLPYAVGDGKAHTLNLYRGSGLTSLLEVRRKTLFFLMGLRRAARLLGQETIETHRLDDLDEIFQIDLLKIDIQGAELMVFDNGKSKLESAVAVHSEVNFFPLYDDQPSFGDVDVELRKHGFLPHSFFHIVKRHVRSRYLGSVRSIERTHLLDGDIIYFRDLSVAADLSTSQLQRMALIADGVYGFHDYALRCLDELERRGEAEEEAILEYVAVLG